VYLTAAKALRGSHEWESSSDITLATAWVRIEPTVQAHTTVTGLATPKLYYFRHRSITPDGASDWDDTISITVV
jgi:spore coat protein U-like protein